MTIDTGFRKHVDMLVDSEGERISEEGLKAALYNLGDPKSYQEKWFNVEGLGYEKNWMYVVGIT